MGSLVLDCPLCCNETFTCQKSLKYHLLSIIENILCPKCSSRFDSIYELAEHLDGDCTSADRKEAQVLNESDLLYVKIEGDDGGETPITDSILAKALLTPSKVAEKIVLGDICEEAVANSKAEGLVGIVKTETMMLQEGQNSELVETNEVDETLIAQGDEMCEDRLHVEGVEGVELNVGDTYSCSSCGVSFSSIVDHINEYHDGQEVVVEITENAQAEEQTQIVINEDGEMVLADGTTVMPDGDILNKLKDSIEIIDEEETDSNEGQALENGSRARMPQFLNTIKQEDCVDKDGRLYTRKVVQIEKFWDDEPRKPVVLKYVLVDGVLTKIQNLKNIPDGADIIEIFQCTKCSVQFSKREQFEAHVCEPEIGSEYKCSMCDSLFVSAQTLSAHMRTHKSGARASSSSSKDESSGGASSTIASSTASGSASAAATCKGPFVCTTCDTVFPSNKSLRLHKRMHEPVKAKEIDAPVEYTLSGVEYRNAESRETFECGVCGKSYDKSYEQIHAAYHSGVNHYDCHICNRKFYTKSNLEMHMRVHGGEKSYACSHCKKGFASEESLRQHLKQHCSSRQYQCAYCSRRFARPHEKVKHERIHTGEKPHECEICGKTFRVSYCLTLHMRTHSGYRPYVCPHCGKRFKAHSVYNHHLMTHSDVRKYKCPYCPKAFKTGVQLAGHKNSHTKPFSCTRCNRPFASLYAARAHMDTHERDNNLKYNCYMCGASYARAFALRDHIKEQHADGDIQTMMVDYDIADEDAAANSILPDARIGGDDGDDDDDDDEGGGGAANGTAVVVDDDGDIRMVALDLVPGGEEEVDDETGAVVEAVEIETTEVVTADVIGSVVH